MKSHQYHSLVIKFLSEGSELKQKSEITGINYKIVLKIWLEFAQDIKILIEKVFFI